MPPAPSSCMAHLRMHYEPDHLKPDGCSPAVCCIKDSFNLFLRATTFLRPNFTTRTTNIQTLGLKFDELEKKHMMIKNERHIKNTYLQTMVERLDGEYT